MKLLNDAYFRAHRTVYDAAKATLTKDFPELFNSQTPKPLSLTIKTELFNHYDKSNGLSKHHVSVFLNFWCNRTEYHAQCAFHTLRWHLSGSTSPLTNEHMMYHRAIWERRQKSRYGTVPSQRPPAVRDTAPPAEAADTAGFVLPSS